MMVTHAHELQAEQDRLAKTRKRLFNPDKDDFTVRFHGKPVTIHAKEIEEFDYFVAEHIKKHLAKHLMGKNEAIQNPQPEDWEALYKKIEVEDL